MVCFQSRYQELCCSDCLVRERGIEGCLHLRNRHDPRRLIVEKEPAEIELTVWNTTPQAKLEQQK
jgi:hypothetical protein